MLIVLSIVSSSGAMSGFIINTGSTRKFTYDFGGEVLSSLPLFDYTRNKVKTQLK